MNRDMQSVSPAVPLQGQVPIEVLITSEYLWRFRMGSVGRRNHVSTLCMEISHILLPVRVQSFVPIALRHVFLLLSFPYRRCSVAD